MGVDAQAGPEGHPLEFWLALPTRTLPHDLVMGGDSRAGSWQPLSITDGSRTWLAVFFPSHHFQDRSIQHLGPLSGRAVVQSLCFLLQSHSQQVKHPDSGVNLPGVDFCHCHLELSPQAHLTSLCISVFAYKVRIRLASTL